MKRMIISEAATPAVEIWYHSSDEPELEFRENIKELGLHCGSIEQALKRRPDGYIHEVAINTPYKDIKLFDTQIEFSSLEIFISLERFDLLTHQESVDAQHNIQRESWLNNIPQSKLIYQFVINLLKKNNIQVIRYENTVEKDGESICIIDPAIIKSIKNLGKFNGE